MLENKMPRKISLFEKIDVGATQPVSTPKTQLKASKAADAWARSVGPKKSTKPLFQDANKAVDKMAADVKDTTSTVGRMKGAGIPQPKEGFKSATGATASPRENPGYKDYKEAPSKEMSYKATPEVGGKRIINFGRKLARIGRSQNVRPKEEAIEEFFNKSKVLNVKAAPGSSNHPEIKKGLDAPTVERNKQPKPAAPSDEPNPFDFSKPAAAPVPPTAPPTPEPAAPPTKAPDAGSAPMATGSKSDAQVPVNLSPAEKSSLDTHYNSAVTAAEPKKSIGFDTKVTGAPKLAGPDDAKKLTINKGENKPKPAGGASSDKEDLAAAKAAIKQRKAAERATAKETKTAEKAAKQASPKGPGITRQTVDRALGRNRTTELLNTAKSTGKKLAGQAMGLLNYATRKKG